MNKNNITIRLEKKKNAEADEFDKSFPYKEKLKQMGQLF